MCPEVVSFKNAPGITSSTSVLETQGESPVMLIVKTDDKWISCPENGAFQNAKHLRLFTRHDGDAQRNFGQQFLRSQWKGTSRMLKYGEMFRKI